MGATGLGYDIASQFGLPIVAPRAGLVPLTFSDDRFKPLAGVAALARVTANGNSFEEAMLFTHRGLSGPAVLQASSYWQEGDTICVNLSPATDLQAELMQARRTDGRKALKTVLGQYLPARLVAHLAEDLAPSGNIADHSDTQLQTLRSTLQNWTLTPAGSEG